VQISKHAFRYFKNKFATAGGKPLVAFRKKLIAKAVPYVIENPKSYLKPGMKVTKKGEEEALFQNMFEVVLKDDYENHFQFREQEAREHELQN
jgi:ABC-type antimicrobial peptide transport system ATPase subunit